MKPALLVLLLLCSGITFAQLPGEQELLTLLANRDPQRIIRCDSLLVKAYRTALSVKKEQYLLNFYNKLESNPDYFISARSMVWVGIITSRPPFSKFAAANAAMQRAINRAVECGDPYLMLQCFEQYAFQGMWTGKQEAALFYFLKANEIRKQVGDRLLTEKSNQTLGAIGELLYQMQEYAQALPYFLQAISLEGPAPHPHTSGINTVALCYQRMGLKDSALAWFQKGLASARASHDTIWEGIVAGNLGALYFEQGADAMALPLLWKDYRSCIRTEPNNAANTLQRLALLYLRHQKVDSALLLARKAYQVLVSTYPPNVHFIRNASKALGDVFRQLQQGDSAFTYYEKYHHLNDSINVAIGRNRADVVQAKLDFEKTSNSINVLLREKQTEKTRRNLLLLGMLLLCAAGWFFFRWQRQQYLNRQLQLLHAQEKIKSEIDNARRQLQEFTENLINKNALIEQLQQQLLQQDDQLIDTLQSQSILTETDWLRFKEMFEKAHPGFMQQLQTHAPGITTAELRLAALLRLNLGNKHMASMLGIGADAVRKTKSRLRQRLPISQEHDLDHYIKSLAVPIPA